MYTRYAFYTEFFLVYVILCCFCGLVIGGDRNDGRGIEDNFNKCIEDAEDLKDTRKLTKNETCNITKNDPQTWEIELTKGTGLLVQKNHDDLTLQIARLSTSVEARKKRMNLMDVIPYLIIPGFISAGVLPWLIPGMKIAVMGVAMMNQMAFTSSLFSLIRGYIFDTSQEEHIVYVNHGYEKYKYKKHSHSFKHR